MVSLCVNPPLEWWYVNQNKKTHIKMHYLTVQSMKSAAVLIEGGAFALFFCPCRRAFGSSSATKKKLITLKGAWVHLELIDS